MPKVLSRAQPRTAHRNSKPRKKRLWYPRYSRPGWWHVIQTVLDSGFHAVDFLFQVLDSGFQSSAGFWIPRAEFRLPMPRIPEFPGFRSPGYLQWGEVNKLVYLCWIYMDLTRQPVTFSAELSSGVSWVELTNKTCNILQKGKQTRFWVGGKHGC